MAKNFLYEEIEVLDRVNVLKPIPDIVYDGLAEPIELREYQRQAFKYFITYFETPELRKNKQIHTLFHMATGSGKTIIMAGLILYLYTQGYRNFVFFVDQSNIIEKTKENFLNPSSSKYLFNNSIDYLGHNVKINLVENFSGTDLSGDDINIIFTSTQGLHAKLGTPSENSLTIEDFEDNPVVFLSDESHHLNALTKRKLNKEDTEAKDSWEYSVMRSLGANRDNILLEFTATIDLKNPQITQKYQDKIIFNYPLFNFRESGYTKDFQNFASDTDLWTRALMACVMSEYRRYLFSDIRQNIKPVVMMKSQIIDESKSFYNDFFTKMKSLSIEELENLESVDFRSAQSPSDEALKDPLQDAFNYFRKHSDGSLNTLLHSLKDSFTEDKSIILYQNKLSKEDQLLVNSLEDKDNPKRVVFAVKMLDEGWDVLNLFDIVRLYDTRQSGKKISSYTMSEAQLIGRAARYCPFQETNDQERNKRKYDSDINNEYRYLETMFFHSKNDSRYISELKQALRETGFQENEPIELTYTLKNTFKDSELYNKGLVFSNKRIPKLRSQVTALEASKRNKVFQYKQTTNIGIVNSLFSNEVVVNNNHNENIEKLYFKEIPYNILVGASERFKGLRFDIVKKKYPQIKNLREFLTSDNYLGNCSIELRFVDFYTGKDIYKALTEAMSDIASHVTAIKQEYTGSTVFEARAFSEVIKNKVITLSEIKEDGQGVSQNSSPNPMYQLNLLNEDWYIFEDNYGTSEEKLFIKYFKTDIAPKLEEKGLEYYVVRNERVSDLAIYSFDDGERFEPDYLLFIKKKHADKYTVNQVYAEPKGNHLLEYDKWKESFLAQIEKEAKVDDKFTFESTYKVVGLPFFNHDERMEEFSEAVTEWLNNF